MKMRSGYKPFMFLLCMSFWFMINGFPGMAKAATETTLPIGQPTLTERSLLEDRTYFALNVDKDKDKDKDKDRGRYTLTVHIAPPGGGSVSPGSGTYKGGEITLTATPHANYTFDHWSGDAKGSSPSVSITMNGNKTVVAHFKKCKGKKCKKHPDDCED